MLRGAFVLEVAPIPDTGDLRDDLRVWLSGIAAYLAEPGMRSVVRALATASTGSRDRGDAFERVVVGPVAQPVVDRIGHARAAGERAPEASAEAVVDLIVGYLTLASIGRAPLDPARIGELVDVLIPAAG